MKNSIFNSTIFFLLILTIGITAGCSAPPTPTNIEPEITVFPASDISRREACLEAQVITKGTGTLDYIRFKYGETEEMMSESEDLSVTSDKISIRIKDLKPGTTYYYCAEGGNSSATIRSERLSFKTVSNNPPTVSAALPMSSGPIGLIVGFSISDDGGEPLTEAGCEVKNSATSEIMTHLLPSDSLHTGEHTMYVSIPRIRSEYKITPFASNSNGKATGEPITFIPGDAVILESPGLLSTLLGSGDNTFDNLVIAGPLNGDDFRFLRRLLRAPLLPGENETENTATSIDLSDAFIVEGGTTYDGSRFTVENTISTGLFANCLLLDDITLPVTAIAMMRDSFSGCTALRTLTIPANVATLYTSSGCEALEEINVSKANPHFRSLDGVLLDSDMTEILWFPPAKEGHYSIPSSVKAIGENAFSGTHISSISFPDDLKSIGRGALSSTMLQEVTLPENLTNIPEALFQNSAMLSTVRIGSEAAYVGSYAFSGCTPDDIYIKAFFPPFVVENAFGSNTADLFGKCMLHVPQGASAGYRRHREWGNFINITED